MYVLFSSPIIANLIWMMTRTSFLQRVRFVMGTHARSDGRTRKRDDGENTDHQPSNSYLRFAHQGKHYTFCITPPKSEGESALVHVMASLRVEIDRMSYPNCINAATQRDKSIVKGVSRYQVKGGQARQRKIRSDDTRTCRSAMRSSSSSTS